jgi:hypothetical protein
MTKIAALAYGALCLGFLINGYLSGTMHFFGSIAFNGAADRQSNPVWFWAYGVFNVLSVALCAWLLMT